MPDMNEVPMSGSRPRLPTKSTAAMIKVRARCPSAHFKRRVYTLSYRVSRALALAFPLTRNLDRVGTTINATSSEASMAKVTVRANGMNIWPTMPPTNMSGRKIATVARVAAVIGVATSLAPPIAASLKPSPCWRRRYMTSTMTMLSSIKRPTAIDMALKVRMLMVISNKYIARKPNNMLNGMDMAVTSEARTAIRKRKTTTIARAPPTNAFSTSELTLDSMKSDWSDTVVSFNSLPRSFPILSASATTALATVTVLDVSSFTTFMVRLGWPSVRVTTAIGTGPWRTSAICPSTTLLSVPGRSRVFSISAKEAYSG